MRLVSLSEQLQMILEEDVPFFNKLGIKKADYNIVAGDTQVLFSLDLEKANQLADTERLVRALVLEIDPLTKKPK